MRLVHCTVPSYATDAQVALANAYAMYQRVCVLRALAPLAAPSPYMRGISLARDCIL